MSDYVDVKHCTSKSNSLTDKFIKSPRFVEILLLLLNKYLKDVHLANHVEILLHDHFSGYIEIANPLGSFSSLGASPLGMKNDSLVIGNFNASLEMIVQ